MAMDLLSGLAELVVRRKINDDGEFAYVFLASGEQIPGKKAAYKRLKSEEAVFEALKDSHQEEGESDLTFDSRALKMMNSVPFEDDAELGDVLAAAEAAMTSSTSAKKSPVKRDWEALTKTALSKLVSRRRLEGGEFTYVYLPLEKTVAGKKALFNFLKNQSVEFSQLTKKAKNPAETQDQFEARVMQQILVVPYEKDVETMEAATGTSAGGKRKIKESAGDPKKAKLDSKIVFVEVEFFSSTELPSQLLQIGAVQGGGTAKFLNEVPGRFLAAVVPKKPGRIGEEILAGLGLTRGPKGFTFQRGHRMAAARKKGEEEIVAQTERAALDLFLQYLTEAKGSCRSLTLVTYRKQEWSVLLTAMRTHGLAKGLAAMASSIVSLEEVIQEKRLNQYLPLVPMVRNYVNLALQKRQPPVNQSVQGKPFPKLLADGAVAGHITADDMAWRLSLATDTMAKTCGFSLPALARAAAAYIEKVAAPGLYKGSQGTFTVNNSENFVRSPVFPLVVSAASTSKVGSSTAPRAPLQAFKGGAATKVTVEKDNFNFSALGSEVLYPLFCQPVLVALNTVDENTKFVKFSLNKTVQAQANAADWELLRDSARVFWKSDLPYAFCHICPNLEKETKNKSGLVKPVGHQAESTVLGTYKALNKTDEEQRNLSTKVTVDLVVTTGPGNPPKMTLAGGGATAVLVTAVLRPGSLTEGNVKQFELRPSDVLVVTDSKLAGCQFANRFVSVDRNQAVPNRAKIVVTGTEKNVVLKAGQIIGSAILFQNNVKLVFSVHGEQGPVTVSEGGDMLAARKWPLGVSQLKQGKKRPLLTVASSRIYAQGNNPLLVKLDQYEATKKSGTFAKAYLQYSDEFKQVIEQNKNVLKIEGLSEKEALVPVIWKRNIPYAFLNVKVPVNKKRPTIDFCDIVANYEVGNWVAADPELPKERRKIGMSICVDFLLKNIYVDQTPTLISCYLKFKDAEVEKVAVMDEVFTVTKSYFPRLDILSAVMKPFTHGRLAPQKTATNDMKVQLVVRSSDASPVLLNAREVISDCQSPDTESLLGFKVCGRKVAAPAMPPMPPQPQVDEFGFDMGGMDSRDPPYDYPHMPARGARRSQDPWDQMDINDPFSGGAMGGGGRYGDSYSSYGGAGMEQGYGGMDQDYMDYSTGPGPQEMAMAMDRSFSRGGSRGGGRGGVHSRLTLPSGGGVHSRLGGRGGQGGGGQERTSWNDGQTWVSGGKFKIDGLGSQNVTTVDTNYDSLYEPAFKAGGGGGPNRNSLFEQARSKLNQRGSAPKTTWSK